MPAKSNSDVAMLLKEKVANENKKDRQGDNRSKLYYLEAPYDATKLDEIFGPENWSLKILKQESRVWEQTLTSFSRNANQREQYQARVASAAVTARLSVTFPDGKRKICDGIGAGDAIRRIDNPNSVETEGLALKAAATDALKRAATLLGNIFGRGMEKDGSQRYDYDFVPPEDDDADPENRPTAPIDAEPPSPPMLAAPQPQVRPQASAQPQAQHQPQARQYQEPNVTSGLSRSSQAQEQFPDQGNFANDPFPPSSSSAPDGLDQDDPLVQALNRIIPTGRLVEVGTPEKWRAIFRELNDARVNWVTTETRLQTMTTILADFRKRAEDQKIITTSTQGAKDIRNYFDSMDGLMNKRRNEILGVNPQAA